MKNKPTSTQDTQPENQWINYPLAEHLFVVILFSLLAPCAWGISLLSSGDYFSGITILVIWVIAYGWLALYLHHINRVRLWISLPSAFLISLACIVVFYLQ